MPSSPGSCERILMSEPAPGRWSSAMRLHIPFVLALSLCLFAGWFELTRALAGREVAWVYAVEWPLFAILGTGIWWRLLHEPTPRRVVPDDSPAPDQLDTDLVAWQEYLARLQAADPPGGPPNRTVNAKRAARDSRQRPTETEHSDS
jgi:hypothetical protein